MPSAPASSAVLTEPASCPDTRTHGEQDVPAVLATMACRLSGPMGPCSWSISTTSAPAAAKAWVATGDGIRLRNPRCGSLPELSRSLIPGMTASVTSTRFMLAVAQDPVHRAEVSGEFRTGRARVPGGVCGACASRRVRRSHGQLRSHDRARPPPSRGCRPARRPSGSVRRGVAWLLGAWSFSTVGLVRRTVRASSGGHPATGTAPTRLARQTPWRRVGVRNPPARPCVLPACEREGVPR